MNQKLNIDIVAKDKSKQALNSVQGALSRLKGAVFNLQNAFIGLGAGLVARNLVNTGKELENLRVRLKFLLKDTNEGAKAFDNMVKFASKVPFSLEEIQSGSGILATVTDNAKDLNKMLEITGNVAAVTGLDFRTTAEQIQRSFSAGIGAADLFREKGVRNMLGFQAGATVSIEATVEAFEKTFGKGGRFGKATDELAETFQGTLSMIGDKVFNFKKVILEAGLFEGLKKEFGALDKFLEENSKQIDRIAEDIGMSLAFAVKKVADFVIILKDNMDKIVNVFKLLIAIKVVKLFLALGGAIQFAAKQMLKFSLASIMTVKGLKGIVTLIAKGGAVYIAFKGIDKLFEETAKSFDNFSDGVKNVLPPARDLHKTMVQVRDAVSEIDTFLYNASSELGIRIPDATEKAIAKFKELNNGVLEDIKKKKENIRMIIAEGINSGITSMSQALSKSLVFGEKLSDTLRNMALNVLARITAILIEQIARQSIQIAMEHAQTVELLKKLSIEKLITDEKRKQQSASAGGSDNMGSSLVRMASSFLGFAKGGAVSKGQPVVVGERGAELFIPNSTGQITQSARGTGGGQTTVNFNINTVDASGFEELLVRSRGTITQLINSAVNERGSKNLI
jgi:hypothetical protein